MKYSRLTKLLLIIALAAPLAQAAQTAQLSISEYKISVELALTPTEQAQGLMFRRQLDENNGMLFIYKHQHEVCMWMKNTVIPLEVAFIDQSGHIINLAQMQPLRKATHCSSKSVHYALEMNNNWFSSRNIKAGDKVLGLPPVNRPSEINASQ